MTIDEFIDKVCQRPLPNDPMGRIRMLAKGTAEEILEEFPMWQPAPQRD